MRRLSLASLTHAVVTLAFASLAVVTLAGGCAEGGVLCDIDTDCPLGEVCRARECVPGPDAALPDAGLDDAGPDAGGDCRDVGCDDGNPCTDDACTDDGCTHAPVEGACDDGDFCNGLDTCAAGACSVHAGDPCSSPTTCDSDASACVGCAVDGDCPDPIAAAWGVCGGFADACAEDGEQTRAVTSFTCVEARCAGLGVTETQACTRDSEGVSCGAPTCGEWSACEASECAADGTRTRTCMDPVCADGLCDPAAERVETEACTREVEGAPCMGGCGTCGGGACEATDPLAGSGWRALGGALTAGTGQTAGRPDVAIDGCEPVVAWTENNRTHVSRWTGSSWATLGGPLDYVTTTTWATGARIAARDGAIVALWAELDGSTYPYAARWDGSAWQRLGERLPSGDMNSFEMDVVIGRDGTPYAAWNASPSGPADVYVARWDGSAWVRLGPALDAGSGGNALAPTLSVDDDGNVTVAWQESSTIRLRRWRGSAWESVGGGSHDRLTGSTSAFDPHLATTPTGFVLGWRESDGAETNVNADRWDGTSWSILASNVDATPGVNTLWMALAVDGRGRTTIAWEEPNGDGTSDVHVRRHDGTLSSLGGPLSAVTGDTDAGLVHVAVDPLDRPVVVFAEEASAGGPRQLRAYRYH